MTFPDWLYLTGPEIIPGPDGSLAFRYSIRPRRWHPGYWRAVWRAKRA